MKCKKKVDKSLKNSAYLTWELLSYFLLTRKDIFWIYEHFNVSLKMMLIVFSISHLLATFIIIIIIIAITNHSYPFRVNEHWNHLNRSQFWHYLSFDINVFQPFNWVFPFFIVIRLLIVVHLIYHHSLFLYTFKWLIEPYIVCQFYMQYKKQESSMDFPVFLL